MPFLIALTLSTAAAWRAQESPPPTPTPDRLSAPATVASPTQVDEGAQIYWLHCQPCHGDQGQGLTDEWRAQYPADHQNCWNSGCHGQRPYQNGFTLPKTVPALIGPHTLAHFATAADLYTLINQAMPYQAPGSLKTEEYWAVTAFLLRGHRLPDSALPIKNEAQAKLIRFDSQTPPGEVTAIPTPHADGSWLISVSFSLSGALLISWIVWHQWTNGRCA